jgi:hypothetical protein
MAVLGTGRDEARLAELAAAAAIPTPHWPSTSPTTPGRIADAAWR